MLNAIYPGEAMFSVVLQDGNTTYGHAVATYGQQHSNCDQLPEDYYDITVKGSMLVGMGARLFGGSGLDARTTSFERFLREIAKACHEVVSAKLNPSLTLCP